MPNFLIEQFPEAIEINGVAYAVNTDYRVGLQIMEDMENPEWSRDELNFIVLNRLYKNPPQDSDDFLAAIEKGMKYLNGGEMPSGSTEGKPRLYSFKKDAALIYSAFNQTHGIDLQKEEMHWWRFQALFMDLGADTAFMSLVNLRRRHTEGKLFDEEKKLISSMGSAFYLEATEIWDEPDEDEIAFVNLLPEEDRKRYWEGRNG